MTPTPAEARVTLRLPTELATLLRDRAVAEHRSLNSEIIYLLEQALYTVIEADAYRDARRSIRPTAAPRVPVS